jgi:nitronate monooxygenase
MACYLHITQATGVDAVCAQGWEAGGHRGTWIAPVEKSQIGLMSLLSNIRDAIFPIPVIAAGGIMDGRGIKAVLALGADAAQLGSAYLWCPEVFILFVISPSPPKLVPSQSYLNKVIN